MGGIASVKIKCIYIFAFVVAITCFCGVSSARGPIKLLPSDGVYHCANPGFGLDDDYVTIESVRSFEKAAGKPLVWAFVAQHWGKGMEFPSEQCRVLNDLGVVPIVGMMPWSSPRGLLDRPGPEKIYSLDRIKRGDFDDDIRRWAREVRSLGFPIMIEFGPECNGSWFPWSAAWNGRAASDGTPIGAYAFRDAYRHIIDVFDEEGAIDVTWAFHIAARPAPDEAWNTASSYYPGDEWIDWVGFSAYGRLRGVGSAKPFAQVVRHVYSGLAGMTQRPIAIFELGTIDTPQSGKPEWIRSALSAIESGAFPRIKAVAWWNKPIRYDGSATTLEIDSSTESLNAYTRGAAFMYTAPVFSE